jgi:predicted transcriptional regulator
MRKQIIVGGNLADAAKRVADAWHRAERGEVFEPEGNVTFVSWAGLSAALTEKRYELLKALHRRPAASIRELSRTLGRDFKRVHEDVSALRQIGLIEVGPDGMLTAGYSEIRAVITMGDAA